MGGDQAPGPELDAVVAVAQLGRPDLQNLGLIVVGDEARIRAGLAERGLKKLPPELSIRHASQVIGMDDAPSSAVRQKKDSSMRVAFDLVKRGEADAVVSAGNSGAMLACGLLVWKRLPGALRPGIVATLPSVSGRCVLCDMGANVEVQPPMLAQFGLLAAVYAQVTTGKSRPKLGVHANGEESSKGTDLTRAAHALLVRLGAAGAPFEFVGYVEGKDIFAGTVDAVATDGFTGNIVLKTTEGAATAIFELLRQSFESSARAKLGALLARPALRDFKRRIDYAEIGGAPLLGVNGLAMICHGRSSGIALKNAVLQARDHVERGLVASIAAALARHAGDLGAAGETSAPPANEESA